MRYKISLPHSLTIILVLAGMIKAAGWPVTDQFQCSQKLVPLMPYTNYTIKNLLNQ